MASILNADFTVVSYNGGAIAGPTGVAKVLTAKPMEPFAPRSTHRGSTFDLVLEYRGEGDFSLSHIVFQAPNYSHVTAPLTAGIVFVSATAPNIAAYSSQFDNACADSYQEAPIAGAPVPAGFFRFAPSGPAAIAPILASSARGRFVHIKFTESAGTDENIDFGPFFLLGSRSSAGSDVATVVRSTGAGYDEMAEDVAACVAAGLMRAPVDRFQVNTLTADNENTLTDMPFVCLVAADDLSSPAHADTKVARAALAAVADAYHTAAAAAAAEAAAANTPNAPRLSRAVNFVVIDATTEASVAERIVQFMGSDVADLTALTAVVTAFANSTATHPAAAVAAATAAAHPTSQFYLLPGLTPADLTEEATEDGSGDPDVTDMNTPLPGAPRAAPMPEAVVPEPKAGAALTLAGGARFVLAAVDARGASVKHVLGAGRNTSAHIAAALAAKNIPALSVSSDATADADAELVKGFAAFAQAFGLACQERNKVHGDSDDADAAFDSAPALPPSADSVAALSAAATADKTDEDDEEDAEQDDDALLASGAAVAEADEALLELLESKLNSAPRLPGDRHPHFPALTVATRDTFRELVIESSAPALVLFCDVSFERATFAAAALALVANVLAEHAVGVTPVLFDMTTNDIPEEFYDDDVYEQMKLYVKKPPAPAKKPAVGGGNKKGGKVAVSLKALQQAPKPICTNAAGLEVFVHDLEYNSLDDDEEDDEEDDDQDAANTNEDPVEGEEQTLSLLDIMNHLREHAAFAFKAPKGSTADKALTASVTAASEFLEALGDTTRSPASIFASLRTVAKIRGVEAWLLPKENTLAAAAIKLYKDAYEAGMAAMRALVFPVGTLMVPLSAPVPAGIDLSGARDVKDIAPGLTRHAKVVNNSLEAIQGIFQGQKTCRAFLRMLTTMLCTHPDVCLAAVAKNKPAFAKFGAAYAAALEQTGVFTVTPRLPEPVVAALGVSYAKTDALLAKLTDAAQFDSVSISFDAKGLRQIGMILEDCVHALRPAVAAHFETELPARTRGLLPSLRCPAALDRVLEGYVDVDVVPAPLGKNGKRPSGPPKGPNGRALSSTRVRNVDSRLVVVMFTDPCDDSYTHLPAIADMVAATTAKHAPKEGEPLPVVFYHMTAEAAAETPFADSLETFPTFVFLRSGYEMGEYRVTAQPGEDVAKTVGVTVDAQLSAASVEDLTAALADVGI